MVDRALALADATGLDALTIRKLALDLGVTPMALSTGSNHWPPTSGPKFSGRSR